MPYRVLVTRRMRPEAVSYLTDRGYEVKLISSGDPVDPELLIREAEGCDGMIVQAEKVPAWVAERLPESIKVIGRHGVGFDSVDAAKLEELGIILTNAPLSNIESVAEHTVMMIAALAKQLKRHDKDLAEASYGRRLNAPYNIQLKGKTVGIIGVGKIGALVARKCRYGFDMNVIGYDAILPKERFPEEVEYAATLDELYARADFVTPHMPLLESNTYMFDKAAFAKMKSTAFFINTSRGKMCREDDLYEALINGQIAGAAIDVWDPEPPQLDNPLLKLGNVILSPHMAGNTYEAEIAMGIDAARGVDEVLSGKPVTWQVNHPGVPRAHR